MQPDDYNLSELLAPSKTLSEATQEELIAALKQKTSACIVAWIERTDDETDLYGADYGGAWATAFGLTHYLSQWVNKRANNFTNLVDE